MAGWYSESKAEIKPNIFVYVRKISALTAVIGLRFFEVTTMGSLDVAVSHVTGSGDHPGRPKWYGSSHTSRLWDNYNLQVADCRWCS